MMEPQYYESYFEDSFVGQLKPGSGGDGDAESIPDEDEDLHPSNIEFEFDSFGPESFIHTPAAPSNEQQQQQPQQQQQQDKTKSQQPATSGLNRSSAQYSSMRKRVPVNMDLLTSNNNVDEGAETIIGVSKTQDLIVTENIIADAPQQQQEPVLARSSAQYSSMRKRVPVNLDLLATIEQTEQKDNLLPQSEFQTQPAQDESNSKKIDLEEQLHQEKQHQGEEQQLPSQIQQRQHIEQHSKPTQDDSVDMQWRDSYPLGANESIKQIDLKVIEPYKKIISHAGYCHTRPLESSATLAPDANQGTEPPAIIVFSACHLPDRSRRDYCYVMDHLFHYVLSSLHELIADDYILIYLHNSCPDQNNLPTFGLLKRFYQMIDRKLRKNLKAMYLVHPTFWLKTLVIMSRPFISSKFSRKVHFVQSIDELATYLPLEKLVLPVNTAANHQDTVTH